MKAGSIIGVLVSITIIIAAVVFFMFAIKPNQLHHGQQDKEIPITLTNMKIISPVFEANQPIPAKYTCDGDNISPPLNISELDKKTKSLALIMDDPDAPDGTFTHWLVWNIAPKTTTIKENRLPSAAIEGKNSADQSKYFGPCPPNGSHRYFFKLFALDQTLDLTAGATRQELEAAMRGHVIGQTELISTYQRS